MKHRSWSQNTSIIPEIKFLSGNLLVKGLIYTTEKINISVLFSMFASY